MSSPKTRIRSGFTLIELLITIAIISLLAAILFPAFGRVREMGRRTSCQSNLKQIGLGILQYNQDYEERFPTTNNGTLYGTSANATAWGLWMVYIYPYVKSPQVFACPSTKRKDTALFTGTPYGDITLPMMFNYGYNQNLMSKSLAAVQQPAQLTLAGDSSGTVIDLPRRVYNANNVQNGGSWWNVPTEIDTNAIRHLDGSNVLFADGHVKYLSQGQMGPDPNRVTQAVPEDRAYLPVRPTDDRLQ